MYVSLKGTVQCFSFSLHYLTEQLHKHWKGYRTYVYDLCVCGVSQPINTLKIYQALTHTTRIQLNPDVSKQTTQTF